MQVECQTALKIAAFPQIQIVPCNRARVLEMEAAIRDEQALQIAVTLPLVRAKILDIDPEWSRCAVLPDHAAPVAAWGAFPQWPGRAVAWALFTPAAAPYSMRVKNATTFHVEQLQQREGLRRLEATVDAGDVAAIRWAQVVGFRIEGLMRQYGVMGEDYLMMARVWL